MQSGTEKKYSEWIRRQPCRVCLDDTNTDSHHIKGVLPAGVGTKVPWLFQIPLCRRHHDLLHSMGWSTWERNMKVSQAVECIRTIDRAMFEGVIKVDL